MQYGGPSPPIKKKKKEKRKIKNQKIYIKIFFIKKNRKVRVLKNKTENMYWPITAKMRTSTQFSTKNVFDASQIQENLEGASGSN